MAKSKDPNHTLPDLFPGAKYRAAAQASVDAILAPQGVRRPVISRGNEFKNADSWTGIQFVENFCNWCQANPGKVPTRAHVQQMVRAANTYRNPNPQILLARTPDRLNRRTQLALVGGGYHEAWHTQYSKRDAITVDEVWSLTQRVGEIVNNGGTFDAKLAGLLKKFNAIIEDIRIERRGCEEYPGVKVPMHDLQDFILDLEKKSREQAAKMTGSTASDVDNARGVLLCVFRDLGLGYNTQSAREAIDYYKRTAPQVVAMCVPGGLLHGQLEASKALGADDKMGYVRVAMECVIALWKAGQATGDEPDLCCPNCGASASNLVIRPARDENGNRKFKMIEVECKACGFKTEMKEPDTSLSTNQQEQDEDKERPEFEDMPPQGGEGEGDSDEDQDQEEGDDNSGAMTDPCPKNGDEDQDGDEDGESDSEGSDSGEGDEEGDDSEDSEGEGDGEGSEDGDSEGSEDGEGSESDGEGDEDGEGDSEGSSEGDSEGDSEGSQDGDQSEGGQPDGSEQQQESEGSGAGGHQFAGQDPDATKQAAGNVLGGDDSQDPLDSNTALTQAFAEETAKENGDLAQGELPWNPYDPSMDTARVVRSRDVETDRANANKMLREVKPEIAALRARLRSIVRAQEMTDIEHGLRRGRRISERMLVDSKLCLMDRKRPNRAYQDKEDTLDTSLSMAICLDQSGSMYGMLRQVAKAMMVLTEPVESIGGKVMAFGFRDGGYYPENYYDYDYHNPENHRLASVHYDVFKHWDERFSNVKWRFAHTQATGGTPMADGVQFGMTALNERSEAHRILCVITDGQPNHPHERVITGQLRRAAQAGIHVIGIGIGREASYVKSLFPDHVHVNRVSDLPSKLIAKLNEVCEFGGRNRGRRIRGLDKRMVKKVS
jgi:hypothetical protein